MSAFMLIRGTKFAARGEPSPVMPAAPGSVSLGLAKPSSVVLPSPARLHLDAPASHDPAESQARTDLQSPASHGHPKPSSLVERREGGEPFSRLMARIWLEKLQGSARREFVMAVKDLSNHWARVLPSAATACSGTDIMRPVVEQIALELKKQMGIKAHVKFVVASEFDAGKREFLRHQHDPPMLCKHNDDLAKSRTWNCTSGQMELVPHFDFYGQGAVCKSATPLSSARGKNENCVAEGTAATGRSFLECLAIIDTHWPTALTLECVKELARETADDLAVDKSDAMHMARKLEERGYWVLIVDIEALDWGAPVRRRRLYWIGIRYPPNFDKALAVPAQTFFTKMLNSFRCPQALTPTDCMVAFDSERQELAESTGVPLLLGTGLRLPMREKQDPDWKLEHMELFPEHGLHWPISPEEIS